MARRQLLAAQATPDDVRRWLRRRELTAVHPGVYVDHTGPLSWRQRAWAAVLLCEPAALWGRSALRLHDGRRDEDADVLVAVAPGRKVVAPAGVQVVRRRRLDERVQWTLQPPRQRFDDAIVDAALAASTATAAVALLSGAVQQRRTNAARLRANLIARPRAGPSRWLLAALLLDIATGATSVLEQAYVDKVERAHGLPASRLQEAVSGRRGASYRDVTYDGLVVELDSRTFHDNARQRDADFERDLDSALEGLETRRLTYGQVVDRPCSTAGKIARLLVRHGWTGRPVECGRTCEAVTVFDEAV